MTSTQDDILDELYFVTSFKEMQKTLELPEKRYARNCKNYWSRSLLNVFSRTRILKLLFRPKPLNKLAEGISTWLPKKAYSRIIPAKWQF